MGTLTIANPFEELLCFPYYIFWPLTLVQSALVAFVSAVIFNYKDQMKRMREQQWCLFHQQWLPKCMFISVSSLQLTLQVLGWVAVLIRYHQWLMSESVKDRGGWYKYQGFINSGFYVPGFITVKLRNTWFMMLSLGKDNAQLKDWRCQHPSKLNFYFHPVMTLLFFVPAVFTHLFPSSLLFIWLFLLFCCLPLCELAAGQGNTVDSATVCGFFFGALVFDIAVFCLIIIIQPYYAGHSYASSIEFLVNSRYCRNEWIVFNPKQFAWHDWFVVLGWIIG